VSESVQDTPSGSGIAPAGTLRGKTLERARPLIAFVEHDHDELQQSSELPEREYCDYHEHASEAFSPTLQFAYLDATITLISVQILLCWDTRDTSCPITKQDQRYLYPVL